MLADAALSDPAWIFERKLDGEGCLVFRSRGGVQLRSRTVKPLNRSYPELVEALAAEPRQDFVADGEIVAFSGRVTSFARLQRRVQIADAPREVVREEPALSPRRARAR